MPKEIRVYGLDGIPESVRVTTWWPLSRRVGGQRLQLCGDVLVVTHKIVSKSEGRLVDLATITPSALAARLCGTVRQGRAPGRGRPARERRVVRMEPAC